jgi:signal transduction histidine kinase
VTALAEHFAKEGLTIRTNIRGTYRDLPGYIEEEVLKIMREAMVNARNHASAKEVDLDCHYDDETLIVTVRDNGDGFEPFRSEKPGHFGLQGMRERAAAVGGKLNIISSDGTGTLIKLVVPTRGAKRDV